MARVICRPRPRASTTSRGRPAPLGSRRSCIRSRAVRLPRRARPRGPRRRDAGRARPSPTVARSPLAAACRAATWRQADDTRPQVVSGDSVRNANVDVVLASHGPATRPTETRATPRARRRSQGHRPGSPGGGSRSRVTSSSNQTSTTSPRSSRLAGVMAARRIRARGRRAAVWETGSSASVSTRWNSATTSCCRKRRAGSAREYRICHRCRGASGFGGHRPPMVPRAPANRAPLGSRRGVGRHTAGLFVTFAIALVVVALWLARGALPVFGIAIALAFLLDPPVTALNRRGVPRLAGILIVYVVVVVAVILLGMLLLRRCSSSSSASWRSCSSPPSSSPGKRRSSNGLPASRCRSPSATRWTRSSRAGSRPSSVCSKPSSDRCSISSPAPPASSSAWSSSRSGCSTSSRTASAFRRPPEVPAGGLADRYEGIALTTSVIGAGFGASSCSGR